MSTMSTMSCLSCKQAKPIDAFSLDSRKPNSRRNLCKQCAALNKKVARMYARARASAAKGKPLYLV